MPHQGRHPYAKHLEALDLENSVYDFFELDDEKILSV